MSDGKVHFAYVFQISLRLFLRRPGHPKSNDCDVVVCIGDVKVIMNRAGELFKQVEVFLIHTGENAVEDAPKGRAE